MKPYYERAGFRIFHGDCREIIPDLEDVDCIITDPPYSVGRAESEFQSSGNVACALHEASKKAPSMLVFGTSSGRGFEFLRSSIRTLPHCRTLAWHRSYVNSPAAGPWRWDLVLIHVFGKGAWGRPQQSSLIQTDGTQSLARELGHKSPVPIEVMAHLYRPFAPGTVLDPFLGSGSTLVAARGLGAVSGTGIELSERYCEIAANRLSQEVLAL